MKKAIKILLSIILTIAVVIVNTSYVVDIDAATTSSMESESIIINGTLLLPAKAVFSSLGLNTSWEQSSHTVIGSNDVSIFSMPIGKKVSLLNGRTVLSTKTALIENGTAYVPAKFVYDLFGYSFNYNSETKILSYSHDKDSSYKNMTVAHGGGLYNGYAITNSIEALNSSYEKGFRTIEVDLACTSDGKYVLVHSWNDMRMIFKIEKDGIMTYDQFMALKMPGGLHQMDVDMLITWINAHPDVKIVTDTKGDNIKMLNDISVMLKDVQANIYPQIYFMEEYAAVRAAGYENILYTLYMSTNTHEEIFNFTKANKLYAIVLPMWMADTDLVKNLNGIGMMVYSHTVFTKEDVKDQMKYGIGGYYTDEVTEVSIKQLNM